MLFRSVDMIQQIREIEGVHGVHIMAYRQEHRVPEIVERTGILEGRRPWSPNWSELATRAPGPGSAAKTAKQA